MSNLVLQIPLVGATLYTAMEFYGMGVLVKSNFISKDQKAEAIFKTVTRVTMSVGSAVTGGILGQVLIPAPIVGGMIGGFIGGAIGSLFGKAIEAVRAEDPIPFSIVVMYIIGKRKAQGFWSFESLDGSFKEVMGRWAALSRSAMIPDDDLWLCILCFFLVSMYIEMLKKRGWRDDRKELEEINQFIEGSIVYLAERVDFLKIQDCVKKAFEVFGVLVSEGWIEMDVDINAKEGK